MSTRSVTKFFWDKQDEDNNQPEAIIYRHSDGYPSGAGVDLVQFLDETAKLTGTMYGTRHNDAAYLAARYVVYLAGLFNYHYENGVGFVDNESRLDFGSVGVMSDVPWDVEYVYHVRCGNPPVLTCFVATFDEDRNKMVEGEQVEIPGNTYASKSAVELPLGSN